MTAVLNTITLAYTQILVDLNGFQTVDGVHFSYGHFRVVSMQLTVDKVLHACPDQMSSACHGTRYAYRVQQSFLLIKFVLYCFK